MRKRIDIHVCYVKLFDEIEEYHIYLLNLSIVYGKK